MRKGSFTIEAAVILWITVMILYAFVFMAFILHDRLVLYGSALYTAVSVVQRIEEPVSEEGRLEIGRLENRNILRIDGYEEDIDTAEEEDCFLSSVRDRLFVSEVEEAHISAERNGALLSYTAHIRLPLSELLLRFLPDSDMIEREIRYDRRADPEEIVRLTGGLFRRR